MTAITIDIDKALDLLATVVDKRGADWVYPDEWRSGPLCQYVVDGKGACIVGALVEEAGLNLSLLEESFDGAEVVLHYYPGVFSANAVQILRAAQSAQDRRHDWGSALFHARSEAESIRAERESINA